jgi:hypothetical protein
MENQTNPTREELIASLKDLIEMKELQARLQSLNTSIVKDRADELESIHKINFYTQKLKEPTFQKVDKVPDGFTEHAVTQEDLDNNPDLVSEGVNVGDVIAYPNQDSSEEKTVPEEPKEYKSNLTVVKTN